MNIMIDIETTGIKPGCAILEIAAVAFDEKFNTIDNIRQKIDLQNQLHNGYVTDIFTMKWWDTQKLTNSVVDPDEDDVLLEDALTVLSEFISYYLKNKIWCKGVSFDFPILKHSFAKEGVTVPWEYRQETCFRTIQSIFPINEEIKNEITNRFIKHKALSDCYSQLAILRQICHEHKNIKI